MPPWLAQLLQLLPEIMKGIGAILWPTALLVLLLIFRRELQGLIRNRKLKRGKLFGQEFELEQELDKLATDTETYASLPIPTTRSISVPTVLSPATPQPDIGERILLEAGTSPKAALMLLAAEIEAELRRFAEAKGIQLGPRSTFRDSMELLKQQAELPSEFLKSTLAFRDVRNKLVHGYDADDDNILRAIDVGLRLLRVLRNLQRKDEG